MARPSVNIALMNGQLGLVAAGTFGVCGLLVASPAAPAAGYGVPFLVKNKAQVTAAFSATGNDVVASAINDFYYKEAGEGMKLYIMAMAQATPLVTLFTAANADKLLTLANGDIRLLCGVKFPSGAYTPTIAGGVDEDVHDAVAEAQDLADAWFARKQPFRYIIEGFAYDGDAGALLDYSTSNKRNGHIVIGECGTSATDTPTSQNATLLALGRAAKAEPQQNIGRIKFGSLATDSYVMWIGGIKPENVSDEDLDTIYDSRYITFEKNKVASGYVFNDDNSLTAPTDDYNNLRYGRVIDNATRVAFATYYQELKEDVDVDADGRLSSAVEKALETAVESAIDAQMRPQMSVKSDGTADVECLVNPDPETYAGLYASNNITNPNFNILQTNQVYLFIRMRPKGCLKYLDVYLGFAA